MDPPRSLLNNPPMAQGGDSPLVNPPWVRPVKCGAKPIFLSPLFVRRRKTFVLRLNADAPTAPVQARALHLIAGPAASPILCAQNRLFESANSTFFIILLNADAADSVCAGVCPHLSARPTASIKCLFYSKRRTANDFLISNRLSVIFQPSFKRVGAQRAPSGSCLPRQRSKGKDKGSCLHFQRDNFAPRPPSAAVGPAIRYTAPVCPVAVGASAFSRGTND